MEAFESSCSRETGTSADSQEISRILQNEKCSLPCLKHPASSSHPESHEFLFKISFNIVLPSTPRSSKWFFFSGFPTKALDVVLSPFVPHAPPSSILI